MIIRGKQQMNQRFKTFVPEKPNNYPLRIYMAQYTILCSALRMQ